MKYFLCSLVFVLFLSVPAAADQDLDPYAFNNVFVYNTFAKRGRNFNVVVMDDKADLKISSAVYVKTDRNVDAYEHYGNYLMVLLWNEIVVIDLSVPSRPELVKRYKLTEHAPWPGFGRIVKEGRQFVFLSGRATAKITADNNINNWVLTEIERSKELHEKTLIQSRYYDCNSPIRKPAPFLIKETPDFKYELVWEREQGPAVWVNKRYLVKTSLKDNLVVSRLLIGKIMESRGEQGR